MKRGCFSEIQCVLASRNNYLVCHSLSENSAQIKILGLQGPDSSVARPTETYCFLSLKHLITSRSRVCTTSLQSLSVSLIVEDHLPRALKKPKKKKTTTIFYLTEHRSSPLVKWSMNCAGIWSDTRESRVHRQYHAWVSSCEASGELSGDWSHQLRFEVSQMDCKYVYLLKYAVMSRRNHRNKWKFYIYYYII